MYHSMMVDIIRLEDPFAPHIRGRSGLDSVRVDELCEINRRIFLKVIEVC